MFHVLSVGDVAKHVALDRRATSSRKRRESMTRSAEAEFRSTSARPLCSRTTLRPQFTWPDSRVIL